MVNKQRDICDECDNCYYYWENNDTENECNGSEAPCEEWIAKRDIDWDAYHKWLQNKEQEDFEDE